MPRPTRNSAPAQARKAVKSLVDKETPNLDVIADEIMSIASAMRAFGASRLKRGTILTLLKEATGVSKTQIEKVLDAAARLDDLYLKK